MDRRHIKYYFSNRKARLFLGCLFVLFISNLGAQSYSIKGTVKDSSDNALELSTVMCTNEKDSVLAGFATTDHEGKFIITGLTTGSYIIGVSYLGFEDFNTHIELQSDMEMGPIRLQSISEKIDEITVSAQAIPITIKKDTVEYNALAFKTRPMDNVEELLKKLPGIEVDDDGTIKAHGEEVQNVLVEGKEFFGNDPTIATKNLPADVVDKIQVFDKRSDMSEFTGIDDGQREKTINLALKEGKKAGYFGNANVGYGSQERYDGKFNLNRFTKSTQLSAIGMANNVNKQGFSFRDYIDFMGGLGNLMSGGQVRLDSREAGLPISQGLGDGFVTTGAGGLNYNVEISKSFEINSSYFYNRIKNEISEDIFRQNLLDNSGFTTEQNSDTKNINKKHQINSTIRAKIDSIHNLIFRLSGGWNDASSSIFSDTKNFTDDGQLQSGGIKDHMSTGDQVNFNLNGTHTYRLKKKGRFISTNLRLGYSDREQMADLSLINIFRSDPRPLTDTLLQEQFLTSDQRNYLIKLSYTEPLGNRRYLELNASRQNFNDDYDKSFFDLFPGRIPDRELNVDLSKKYHRDYSYNRMGINLKWNSNNSSLTLGASLQHSDLNGVFQDPFNESDPITNDYVYLLPSLFWNREFGPVKSLRVRYTTNIREPSLDQLQPVIDNSDPFNIYIGNPALNPEFRHRLNLNYNSYDQFNNIGFFGQLSANYTSNSITNVRTINEFFVQTTSPVNTDYSLNTSIYVNFNAPLKFIKQRINISNSTSFNDSKYFINGVLNQAYRTNNRVSLSIDNWNKDVIDLELGTRIGWNTTRYSLNSEANQTFADYQYFIDLDLDLKGDWDFGTYFRYDFYSEEDFGDQLSIPRWEASLSKLLLKSKKMRLELAVVDILNRNQNIHRNSNINYLEDRRINSLGRYFMLSMAYSFSGFGQENIFGRRRGQGRSR